MADMMEEKQRRERETMQRTLARGLMEVAEIERETARQKAHDEAFEKAMKEHHRVIAEGMNPLRGRRGRESEAMREAVDEYNNPYSRRNRRKWG